MSTANSVLRDELTAAVRQAAQESENTPCNEATDEYRLTDCPSCAMPVQVFSVIDGIIQSVYADVDPLAALLLPVIARHVQAARADELRNTAQVIYESGRQWSPNTLGDWLLDRAATLCATPIHSNEQETP